VVVSEVIDNVPQFAAVHPYLPTHWWNSFDALLRVPVDTGTLGRSYVGLAGLIALTWDFMVWPGLLVST
jgi:ABC-2 type transport system permease protein